MLIKATDILAAHIQKALAELYQLDVDTNSIVLQQTKKEFEGDFTLVVYTRCFSIYQGLQKRSGANGGRNWEQIKS